MGGKLSAVKVRSLVKPGRYGDGGGLYFQVRGSEQRSWIFRYKLAGKAHWMGLGEAELVSLAEARDKAVACRRLLLEGVDPLTHRKGERAKAAAAAGDAMTFGDVVDRYLAAHAAGWRNPKHRQQWRNTLDTYAAPVFAAYPVAAVDTGAVMKAIEPIWTEKPETAGRLRGRIEAVLAYATARAWRSGENPARWRGHLENLLPARSKVAKVEHHAALPWADIGAFMVELAPQPGVGAKALAFTILTAARTGEVIGARWPEIDLEERVWVVPGERMKAGREHRVPLTDAAVEVLREMLQLRDAEHGDFVFPGSRSGTGLSNMTITAVLRRMGRGDITTHGFRSTFRDWAAESTNFPREVAEQALAHTLKDRVEAAYRRGDLFVKRRKLMEAWAKFCAAPAIKADTVMPIRRSAAR